MIRFATIGTNFIVDRFLEYASKQEELIYVCVYSRAESTASAFRARHHAERICTSLGELAEAKDVDAVYLASPNSIHYEQAMLLLSHGKHVLCEKTITSNASELTALIQTANHNKVVLLEAIRTCFTPGYDVLLKHLPRLGTIRRASFRYCQYSSRYDKFKEGIIENAFDLQYSNGALMDIGVYCIHPLVRLFGMPDSIQTDVLLLHNGIDGAGTIMAHYPNMQAELVYSKISNSRTPSEIQGENGTIVIDGINNPHEIHYYNQTGKKEVLLSIAHDPDMSGEIREWIRLIKSGDHTGNHNLNSLMALQLMDQARKQMGIYFPADTR